MHEAWEFAANAFLIGIGATVIMDLWALFLKRIFGIRPLDYALVGRWLGHFPRGRFAHANIGQAEPVIGEAVLGWSAHYAIGVAFAALLIAVFGLGWARNPTLLSAVAVGLATVAIPFFIMQPAFGLGIGASKTPNPNIARLRSLMTHLSFAIGLYVSAELSAAVLSWGTA